MDIKFLQDYFVVVVVGVCLTIGYIIKNLDFINNKYIPLIVGVLGVIMNMWVNEWAINPQILLGGLFSGLASTGMYELFNNLIFKRDVIKDSNEAQQI